MRSGISAQILLPQPCVESFLPQPFTTRLVKLRRQRGPWSNNSYTLHFPHIPCESISPTPCHAKTLMNRNDPRPKTSLHPQPGTTNFEPFSPIGHAASGAWDHLAHPQLHTVQLLLVWGDVVFSGRAWGCILLAPSG